MVIKLINVLGNDDGNDEVASCHPQSSHHQHWLTASAVDPEDGWDSGDEHDDTDHAGCEETGGILAETKLFEDVGGIVEHLGGVTKVSLGAYRTKIGWFGERSHGIDSTPLLEEHRHGSNNNPLKHSLCLEEGPDGNKLQFEDIPGGRLT